MLSYSTLFFNVLHMLCLFRLFSSLFKGEKIDKTVIDIRDVKDKKKIIILNEDGTLNDRVPKRYEGLDRLNARKKIIEELSNLGLIEKIEEHTSAIPRGERTGEIVEPYLSDQWFVSAGLLAEKAIKVVKSGEIEFIPKNTENIYFSWMRSIEDWCISRQLWWGHQIPAWHDQDKNIFVGRSEEEIINKITNLC